MAMQRTEDILCLPLSFSTLVFKTGSLREFEAHCFGYTVFHCASYYAYVTEELYGEGW